jgi:hypothetical protein
MIILEQRFIITVLRLLIVFIFLYLPNLTQSHEISIYLQIKFYYNLLNSLLDFQ